MAGHLPITFRVQGSLDNAARPGFSNQLIHPPSILQSSIVGPKSWHTIRSMKPLPVMSAPMIATGVSKLWMLYTFHAWGYISSYHMNTAGVWLAGVGIVERPCSIDWIVEELYSSRIEPRALRITLVISWVLERCLCRYDLHYETWGFIVLGEVECLDPVSISPLLKSGWFKYRCNNAIRHVQWNLVLMRSRSLEWPWHRAYFIIRLCKCVG